MHEFLLSINFSTPTSGDSCLSSPHENLSVRAESSFSSSLSSSLLMAVGTLDTLELESLETGWREPE